MSLDFEIDNAAIVDFAFGEGVIESLPEELRDQQAELLEVIRDKRLSLVAVAIADQLVERRETVMHRRADLVTETHIDRRELHDIDVAFEKLLNVFGTYADGLDHEAKPIVAVIYQADLIKRAECSGIQKNIVSRSLEWVAKRYIDIANSNYHYDQEGREVGFCVEFFDIKKEGTKIVDVEDMDLVSLFNFVDKVNQAHLSGVSSYADLGGRGYSENTHRVLSYLTYTLRNDYFRPMEQ